MTERIVHFIFGLRPQDEPFHLLHYLAIESCRRVVQADEIRLHVHHLPYGFYWDLARPLVQLERIEPLAEVDDVPLGEDIAPFRYAHHSDVIRLDILGRDGGMYADIDTIFLQPVPDRFWEHDAVIGREGDVAYGDAAGLEPSVSNALMFARAGSSFITRWRDQILGAMDGTWSGHSCRLAMRLTEELPGVALVEPQASFSPFDHTPEGMRALLEEPLVPGALDHTYSVHLCAHLWWERSRRDFSTFSAADVTETYLRRASTPLAHAARPHLPDHGLF
jgi:hypothetical protein